MNAAPAGNHRRRKSLIDRSWKAVRQGFIVRMVGLGVCAAIGIYFEFPLLWWFMLAGLACGVFVAVGFRGKNSRAVRILLCCSLGLCFLFDLNIARYLTDHRITISDHLQGLTMTPMYSLMTLSDWSLLGAFVVFQGLLLIAAIRIRLTSP